MVEELEFIVFSYLVSYQTSNFKTSGINNFFEVFQIPDNLDIKPWQFRENCLPSRLLKMQALVETASLKVHSNQPVNSSELQEGIEVADSSIHSTENEISPSPAARIFTENEILLSLMAFLAARTQVL